MTWAEKTTRDKASQPPRRYRMLPLLAGSATATALLKELQTGTGAIADQPGSAGFVLEKAAHQ